jgi:hypothetical protein
VQVDYRCRPDWCGRYGCARKQELGRKRVTEHFKGRTVWQAPRGLHIPTAPVEEGVTELVDNAEPVSAALYALPFIRRDFPPSAGRASVHPYREPIALEWHKQGLKTTTLGRQRRLASGGTCEPACRADIEPTSVAAIRKR